MLYSWYMTNNRDYRFEPFEFAKENGFKVSDYDLAQGGEIFSASDDEALDFLFSLMNRSQKNHPGVRSMSVSDIILLSDDDELNIRVYYCDVFGWTKLDFWKDI